MNIKNEKSFPWIAIVILVAFGLLCFVGGILVSNIANKKQLNIAQTRLSECENKFIAFSGKVMVNTDAIVDLSNGVVSVWQSSVSSGSDFSDNVSEFLEQNKRSISSIKLNNDLIDIQMPELKKYAYKSNIEYDAVMKLYDVYKELYDLGMTPGGTLEGFKTNRDNLVIKYKEIQEKLFVHMPMLENVVRELVKTAEPRAPVKDTSAPQVKPVEQIKPVDKVKPSDKTPDQRLGFDPRIKNISGDMTYRQVESLVGVARDKMKDSQGHEAWIYPSEKAGFRNVVYFSSGKVIQSKNIPLNGSLD